MIFLTVGTQLPFDRLVRALDAWCAVSGDRDVFGQIGEPGPAGHRPAYFEWTSFIEPAEFQRRFEQADLIVSHAGMGSLITALTLAKPILIMPRRAAYREHRNDHQLATLKRFAGRPGIFTANDEHDIATELDKITRSCNPAGTRIGQFADPRLVGAVRAVIFGAET